MHNFGLKFSGKNVSILASFIAGLMEEEGGGGGGEVVVRVFYAAATLVMVLKLGNPRTEDRV